MNKNPIFYTLEQTEEVRAHLEKMFGKCGDYSIHEIQSEYVHTDMEIRTTEEGLHAYVTLGMGARPMKAPVPELQHTELVMITSSGIDPLNEKGMIVANELTKLSKFPFRNDTWLGAGHTINASDAFKEAFGYDALIFFNPYLSLEITDIDDLNFIVAIPIYKDEREWIMENGSFEYLDLLYDEFGERIMIADNKRGHFIPQ